MQPRIALIFTGGTISMRIEPETGGAIPALSGEELLALVPGLERLASFDLTDFSRWPGPHVTPPRMLELARHTQAKLADPLIDGAVITHGTDTLEETAFLLDHVIDSTKPVVLVGAMRNSSELSWDGPANLFAAVRVAADPQARNLGPLVVFADQILAASEATKTHTEAVDTFQSPNFGPLGIVDKDRIIITRQRRDREIISTPTLNVQVDIISIYAGSDGRLIDHAINDGADGLVIEALGRGNVTVAALPAIQRALELHLPVVITSRCHRGRVLDTYGYEGGGRQLHKMGTIRGGMLPAHKARIKLMLALAARWDADQIRQSFESFA